MNSETPRSQAEQEQEEDTEIDPAVLDRIKHPPAIDSVMNELSPEELMSNPAVVPQTYNEPGDLRDDMKRD
ncbi:hypothetical protein [Aliterella atlantica]|uniref:Uncharacterized protein n=1 Tax=Aliterella atlantica CENA595 TaxID=1618023 RepID=A0A0D8ZY19_9CYAN|nr:hypothetical protein [Aliterella atlantica]KJH73334.1 hypothetical protein UH38_00640 [Aliterella atlantica CENA595]